MQLIVDALATKYGLKPIKVVSTNSGRRLGSANYSRRIIRISTNIIDEDLLEDTLLHEFAHILASDKHGSPGKGHGPYWKKYAELLGANPYSSQQVSKDQRIDTYKYVYKCEKGCKIYAYRRRPSFDNNLYVCKNHKLDFKRYRVRNNPS